MSLKIETYSMPTKSEYVPQQCPDSCAIASILMMIGKNDSFWLEVQSATELANFEYNKENKLVYWHFPFEQFPTIWHTIKGKGCLNFHRTQEIIGFHTNNIITWQHGNNNNIVFPCSGRVIYEDGSMHRITFWYDSNTNRIEILDPLPLEKRSVKSENVTNLVKEVTGIIYPSSNQKKMSHQEFCQMEFYSEN